MRSFKDGRSHLRRALAAKAFPIVKDLVNRSLFVRPHHSSRRVCVGEHGGTPDANDVPVPKPDAELAMDAAECIAARACAAACKNASAMLFVSAESSPPGPVASGPAGTPVRVRKLVHAMDRKGFALVARINGMRGSLSLRISVTTHSQMIANYCKSLINGPGESGKAGAAAKSPLIAGRGD